MRVVSSEIFVKSDGSLLQEGDLLINIKLGQTLRRIAADPGTFYNGSLAADIVADIAEYGGNITATDLRDYRAAIKEPLNLTLKNGRYTLYNPPPPASGAIISFIMSILDGIITAYRLDYRTISILQEQNMYSSLASHTLISQILRGFCLKYGITCSPSPQVSEVYVVIDMFNFYWNVYLSM